MLVLHVFDTLAIHTQMTNEELQFYFGSASEELPEYELILWPVTYQEIVHLKAFGRHLELKLEANSHLLPPNFQFNIISSEGRYSDHRRPQECHYLFSNASCTAAVSFCPGVLVRGFIFLSDDTWEVLPLTSRLEALLDSEDDPDWSRHIVKRVSSPRGSFDDAIREDLPNINEEYFEPLPLPMARFSRFHRSKRTLDSYSNEALTNTNPILEAALFLDEPGYILFSPYFNNDDSKLRDMLLAYVNAVQALYHHSSTGQTLDIVLVRLDILKKQPVDLPHYGGDRSRLLDSFCAYAAKHNPAGDQDPDHWDISLYVSGLDFYAMENGIHSGATMGLATVGGVCTEKYSCIIAELGSTNEYGQPYPSSGFTAIYILAHEIGHNLGMHHDGSSNYCPKEGFIMSPSRGTSGEVSWSSCSSQVMQTLQSKECLQDMPKKKTSTMNHSKFNENPGRIWDAKKQCEILLRDTQAEVWTVENGESICLILRCQSKNHPGKVYISGPALDGTECSSGSKCKSGECVRFSSPPPKSSTDTSPPLSTSDGVWGDWKPVGECQSECLVKSKGYQMIRRVCKDGKCKGDDERTVLCKDEKICKKTKRVSVSEYATKKCAELHKVVSYIDENSSGIQTPYNEEKLWTSCAIFCRKKTSGEYFAPRVDHLRGSNYPNEDLYFPDGTWCHGDGKSQFYCLTHECVPESKLTKPSKARRDNPLATLFDDYNLLDNSLNPAAYDYETLQQNQPFDLEKGVDVHDYIELPK